MNPFLSGQTTEQASSQKEASPQKETSTEKVLTDILEQEQQCLEQLIQLLKTENTAILEREVNSINHLLDKKLILLSKLDQLDKQRQYFFEQQTGISYSHSNFSHFIKQYPSKTIQTMWKTVKVKLPECKKQNELNGRMINIQKENTDQILQILLGHPVDNTQTYSHLGQTSLKKPGLKKQSALYTEV